VKLAAYGITHQQAVRGDPSSANQEAGGSVLEMAEAEYMVRASGYLKTLDDFRVIPI
jgi:Cu(I)/Ag(I) efflux system membrane protein CusA/SilA